MKKRFTDIASTFMRVDNNSSKLKGEKEMKLIDNVVKVINTQNIGTVMSRLGSAIINPNALTGMGVVLVPVTVGLAVRGTIKAVRAVDESDGDIDTFDKARLVWKYYIPAVVSGSMCIVCIIASNRVSSKERAALASALAVSEEAVRQYQAELEKKTGIKTKVERVKDIDEETREKLSSLPKDDEVWCQDLVTGNMFKTSKAKIDLVNGMIIKANEKNAQLRHSELSYSYSDFDYYTINDMYGALGVGRIEIGDDYYIRCDGTEPLIVNSDVTLNGEFMLTLDYYTFREFDEL